MKKNKLLVAIGVAIIVTITIISIHENHRHIDDQGEVRVGVVLPLTGLLSEMGHMEKDAMLLALKEILEVKDFGVKIKLLIEDGKGDTKTVVTTANRLINIEKVDLIIASTSGACKAIEPLAKASGIPLFAFCMDREIAEESSVTMRYYLGLEQESEAIAKYLLTLKKSCKVGILHGSVSTWINAINTVYLPILGHHFNNQLLIEEYDLSKQDFKDVLVRMQGKGVDTLVILGYGFEYGSMFKQMVELGLRQKFDIIGGWGFLYTSIPEDQKENIKVAGPQYVFKKTENGLRFSEKFHKEYGYVPNFDAAFAYEVIFRLPSILVDYNKIANKTPTDMKTILSSRGRIEGVVGDYHFTVGGSMKTEAGMGVFNGGKLKELGDGAYER